MDRHTAASLDHWLTTDPLGDAPDIILPGDKGWPICGQCGGFLRREPDEREMKVVYQHCQGRGRLHGIGLAHLMACLDCRRFFRNRDWYATNCGEEDRHDPHLFPGWSWFRNTRICRHCQHRNVSEELE